MKSLSVFAALAFAACPVFAQSDDAAPQFDAQFRALREAPQAPRAAGAASQAPVQTGINLLGQFPPGTDGLSQKDIGTCHDFAATALLEAAYFRSAGRHVTLSKADFFLQYSILRSDGGLNAAAQRGNDPIPETQHFYSDYVHNGGAEHEAPSEGDAIVNNLYFALRNGIATESALPYEQFRREYDANERPAVERDMAAADKEAAALNRRNGVDPQAPIQVGDLTSNVATMRREEAVQLQIGDAERARVKRYLARLGPARAERLVRERAQMRDETKGFQPTWWAPQIATPADAHALTSAQCLALGPDREEHIVAELNAGRPVGIDFDLAGLPGWGYEKATAAEHAILIDGMTYRDGRPVFTTLNSWGSGMNVPLAEDQLCRIRSMAGVTIPGEK